MTVLSWSGLKPVAGVIFSAAYIAAVTAFVIGRLSKKR
jgi:hypothetical protein